MVWYFTSGAIAMLVALVTFGVPANPFLIEVESEDQVEFSSALVLSLAIVLALLFELFYFLFQLDLDEENKDDTCFPFLCRGFRRRRISAIGYATVRLPLLVVAMYTSRWMFLAMLIWLPVVLVIPWIIYAPLLGCTRLVRAIQRDVRELGSGHVSV